MSTRLQNFNIREYSFHEYKLRHSKDILEKKLEMFSFHFGLKIEHYSPFRYNYKTIVQRTI